MQQTPKFQQIFSGIDESMGEIRSAISSVRAGLHRIHDTNAPELVREGTDKNMSNGNDLIGLLATHAAELMLLRTELIQLGRKVNELI